jgi:hypothetical protein
VFCVLQLFRKRKDKFPMHLEQTYLRYMTFVIESAIQNMKNGQEQWIWVLDLAGKEKQLAGRPVLVMASLSIAQLACVACPAGALVAHS